MRFANVDGQKIGVLFVILVNLNDVADLATERRSSKASKDQHERTIAGALANVKAGDAVQCYNPRVRRIAAYFQRAAMHVRQSVPHHAVRVSRTSCHHGQSDKGSDEEHAKYSRRPFPKTFHANSLQTLNLAMLKQENAPQGFRGSQPGPNAARQVTTERKS